MYRRGFKTWCETVAAQKRKSLKLASHAPLCPRKVAAQLGVMIVTPDRISGLKTETLPRLLVEDPGAWSAVTLSEDGFHVIIVNTQHSSGRQASDLMHELAHLIIGHEPSWASETEGGVMILSSFDRNKEDEANWLSGSLLLPREALLHIRRRKIAADEACETYGCSQEMLTYRFRVTGVDVQMSRARTFSNR